MTLPARRPTLLGVLVLGLLATTGAVANAQPAPDPTTGSPTRIAPLPSASAPPAQVVADGLTRPGVAAQPGELTVLAVHEQAGRLEITTNPVQDRSAAVREVARQQAGSGILAVGLDVPRQARVSVEPATAAGPQGSADRAQLATNDPYFAEQWGMAAAGAERAWSLSTGTGVVVAVIDTGVDGNHPDLRGRVRTGTAFPADPSHGGNVDVAQHGTHVAGIIAAGADDGIGVAGVAPNAFILPVRVFDEEGYASTSDLVRGITYAADQGADVINMSYTQTIPTDPERAAVAYARTKGAVLIAAGGNSGEYVPADTPIYPAALPGVLGVGNEQQLPPGTMNSSSNQGTFIDLAAPGTMILSTLPDGEYGFMTGSSMSAPMVSGAAALILSRQPGLTATQVERALLGTATDLGSPGYDRAAGFGRVDILQAVSASDCLAAGPCTRTPNPLARNADQEYVNRVHTDLLARPATGEELWVNAGIPPARFVPAVTSSEEFRSPFVQDLYERLLDRTPAAPEMSTWLSTMRQGGTRPQVEASVLASTEYYARTGRTDSGWVQALYRDVLGRSASGGEVATWTNALRAGSSRSAVALYVLTSGERTAREVTSWYQQLLGRTPTPAESSAGISRAQASRIETVIDTLAAGGEYRQRPARDFGTRAGVLRGGAPAGH